jgi:hypothetical protein
MHSDTILTMQVVSYSFIFPLGTALLILYTDIMCSGGGGGDSAHNTGTKPSFVSVSL